MYLILLLVSAILLLSLLLNTWKQQRNYWQKKGVKSLPPLPIVGHMLPVLLSQESLSEFIQNLYNTFQKERYFGILQSTTPTLVIKDPELIRSISIKDFDHFVDHAGFVPADIDPLWGKNLFSSKGNRWRNLRQTISPVFTSSKMRMIFLLMDECAQDFINYFRNQDKNIIEIEAQDTFRRYTNDIIASTAFGLKCNSLRDENNEFFVHGQELTDFTGWKRLLFFAHANFPTLAKVLKLKIVPTKVGDFFTDIIKETIKLREEQGVIRQDLIHLLLQARKGKFRDDNEKNLPKVGYAEVEEFTTNSETNQQFLTDEDITAQALVFFFGGFDTVSSQMSFLSYELAINPAIQKRLREEIQINLDGNNGKITYESLLRMKYLDMVVNEAMRKWPQATFVDRVCTKQLTVEPELNDEQPLTINVGDVLWLPIYAIHRDPEYYPNPDKFDPERFNDENKNKIKSSTYLPFGSGPRNCIGSRFALLETKTIICHLLINFEIVPTDKTQIPLKIDKNNFQLAAEGGFHLGLKKLSI